MRLSITPIPLAFLAASAAAAQQRPPVRQLGPVVAKASESFAIVAGVRALPGGRVLVNDITRRRVVLLDSALATVTVVADSTSSTANAYGPRPGGLIAYRGDSTLFVDPASMSMLVIDPAGKIARVMSVPRSQDAASLAGVAFGGAGLDAAGRLVYRSPNRMMMSMNAAGGGRPTIPEQPDTAPIVRVDLASRKLDTLGFIKTPRVRMQMSRDENGRMTMMSEVNPLPVVDEWAVLVDGSVAIVRGRDYHVDWINPDGTRSSSPKIPFDWQRLTDEDKVAFIDSVKAARARMQANGQAGGQVIVGPGGPPPGAAPGGTQIMITRMDGPGGAGNPPPSGGQVAPPQVNFVSPSELPDYKPPFFAGAVRADTEGNLWIRTIPTQKIEGGPVYDVVNRRGELVDRVQVPAGRLILGFGPGGAVYLGAREANGFTFERARVR
jgi:hypothetical protein